MNKLLLIALGGLLAQLVDGSLGMGFGATSTTLLLALAAMNPASVSAVVHVAELGTTLASGVSHWRFNNIDWKVVLRLGLPGAVGAFAGATLLSNLSLATAKPVMATILTLIGINLVLRFSTGRRTARGTGAPATPPPNPRLPRALRRVRGRRRWGRLGVGHQLHPDEHRQNRTPPHRGYCQYR